jgi:hypothetical protein
MLRGMAREGAMRNWYVIIVAAVVVILLLAFFLWPQTPGEIADPPPDGQGDPTEPNFTPPPE